MGSPIQRFMDQSLFSAPHDLSQSITSFIASYCQGIHQTPFSRLIWSRKRETYLMSYRFATWGLDCSIPKYRLARSLRQSRWTSWQVHPSFFWTKSHTFPPPILEPWLPMSVGPIRRIEDKCVIAWSRGLVYLTWTTLFVSAGRPLEDRGNSLDQRLASPKRVQHQTEIIPLLRAIKQCWFVVLRLVLKLLCISLNDVKTSDWTAKHLNSA